MWVDLLFLLPASMKPRTSSCPNTASLPLRIYRTRKPEACFTSPKVAKNENLPPSLSRPRMGEGIPGKIAAGQASREGQAVGHSEARERLLRQAVAGVPRRGLVLDAAQAGAE